jgi:hypothetical protein
MLPPLYITGPFYIFNQSSFAKKRNRLKENKLEDVTTVFFMTMDDAPLTVHGFVVNLLAVVASIGLIKEDPCGIREICVKDTRLVFIAIN